MKFSNYLKKTFMRFWPYRDKSLSLYERFVEHDAEGYNTLMSIAELAADRVQNGLTLDNIERRVNLIGFSRLDYENSAIANVVSAFVKAHNAQLVDAISKSNAIVSEAKYTFDHENGELEILLPPCLKFHAWRIVENLPNIEEYIRGIKNVEALDAHELCYMLARGLKATKNTKLVTGTNWQVHPKTKFLHSWIEMTDTDSETNKTEVICIDPARGFAMEKIGYYELYHAQPIEKINIADIHREVDCVKTLLEESPLGVMLYLSSRKEALERAKQIKNNNENQSN